MHFLSFRREVCSWERLFSGPVPRGFCHGMSRITWEDGRWLDGFGKLDCVGMVLLPEWFAVLCCLTEIGESVCS